MGSEGPKAVTFHVTGFKKFQGVAENPTETIVNNLKGFVKRRGLPPGVTVDSCTVLEAAKDGALPVLMKTFESSITRTNTNNELIWIHMGVNSGSSKFALERQAVNEATFRCPDQLGWQPQQLPIVPEDGGISRTRQTSLSIEAIQKFLKKRGFDAVISDDADRFMCNYVYYHSLRFAEQEGHKSLFLHIPLFSTIDEDTQMEFVATLLEAIASTC